MLINTPFGAITREGLIAALKTLVALFSIIQALLQVIDRVVKSTEE